MSCSVPPELTDAQLLTSLDGEDAPEVAMHLEQCPHCRTRFDRFARLQLRLGERLYRAACPPSLALGEYHLDTLPPAQSAVIARHVAECPACHREVAQLQSYLADLAPDLALSPLARVRASIRVVIAQLAGDLAGGFGWQPALAPAYAGLRGAEAGPAIYAADGVQIVVDVQDDAEQPGHKALFGLVTGFADPTQATIHLWGDPGPVATRSLDEAGNFVIAGLTPGRYELILSTPEVEIHVQELIIST